MERKNNYYLFPLFLIVIIQITSCNGKKNEEKDKEQQVLLENNQKLPDSLKNIVEVYLSNYHKVWKKYEIYFKKLIRDKKKISLKEKEYQALLRNVIKWEVAIDSLVPYLENTEYLQRYQKTRQDFRQVKTIFEREFAIDSLAPAEKE